MYCVCSYGADLHLVVSLSFGSKSNHHVKVPAYCGEPCNCYVCVLCYSGRLNCANDVEVATEAAADTDDVSVYCYMVEHCIQRAQHNQVIFCPRHGNLGPYFIASRDGLVFAAHAAPDLVRT